LFFRNKGFNSKCLINFLIFSVLCFKYKLNKHKVKTIQKTILIIYININVYRTENITFVERLNNPWAPMVSDHEVSKFLVILNPEISILFK